MKSTEHAEHRHANIYTDAQRIVRAHAIQPISSDGFFQECSNSYTNKNIIDIYLKSMIKNHIVAYSRRRIGYI